MPFKKYLSYIVLMFLVLGTSVYLFQPESHVSAQLGEIPFGGRFESIRNLCCDGTVLYNFDPVTPMSMLTVKTGPGMEAYREMFHLPLPSSCALGFVRPSICMTVTSFCLLPEPTMEITMIGSSFPGCSLVDGEMVDPWEPEPEDPDAPRVTLTVDPSSYPEDEMPDRVTLRWESENVENCESPDFNVPNQRVNGSVSVEAPEETTTFTINCSGPDGSASDTATVTVSDEDFCPYPSLTAAGLRRVPPYWRGLDDPDTSDRIRQEVIDKIGVVMAEMPWPTWITSACTKPGAGSRRADGGSQHFVGKAVDLQPVRGADRTKENLERLRDSCLRNGFNFSYVGKNRDGNWSFVHCDIGPRR